VEGGTDSHGTLQMSKKKDRWQAAALYQSVSRMAHASVRAEAGAHDRLDLPTGHGDTPIADGILAASEELSCVLDSSLHRPRELTKMKKFRFQLLHRWMLDHLEPCRVADVGGGKGLLAYLLQQSGWQAMVIDPIRQALPARYKDLATNRQVHIAETEQVPRIDRAFEPGMARDFDLLVAVHAHGCNIQLMEAAAQFNCSFITLPCCVIEEPLYPPAGTHWLQCVVDYAVRRGFQVEPFRLNFKGQNIGLYARAMEMGRPR
jgi:hypothetical protein